MEKHILSKSTYIKGEQCLKQLYLHKKRPFLRDRMPAERIAIFSRGTNVGIYAQQLFPGGIDAGPKHPSQYRKAVIKTEELIENGQEIIYEAAFQANKTLILLDILVKNGDTWNAYEVKSSKLLSETYYKDAALQYYVLINAGININTFSLIHINENYIRKGEIEKEKLFVITDVTKTVKEQYSKVEDNINNQIAILSGDHSPKIEIGEHCFKPYDCDFIGHCWKKINKPSIFDIPSIEWNSKFKLLNNNIELAELKNDSNTTEIQRQQIDTQLSKKLFFNLSKDFFTKLKSKSKELFAIKILNFTPALPLYDNTKPYQQLAFAFAVLPIDTEGDIKVYISDGKSNPNNEILNKINELSDNKTFICYDNKNSDINLFDLREVCINNYFYHPAMTKNFSNKELSKALGIKPPWKSIESDIVAAQYYDEILRGHKKSEEKRDLVEKYLLKETKLVKLFYNYLESNI